GQIEAGGASEDCLYLNVWSQDLKGSLPVLFFIHGGAYVGGEASDFSPKAWSENLALKWVQDNIGRFGGNSKRVTIFGGSAGSSSVSQHTISPYSKGLFSQSFSMSGSAIAEFARGTNTIEFSRDYVKLLKCDTGDLLTCMQSKTLDQLYAVNAGYEGGCGPASLDWLGFAPIIDGNFLPLQPEIAMAKADPIPTLIGLNQKEGRAFALQGTFPFSVLPPEYVFYTSTSFANYVAKWITSKGYTKSENATAHNDIFAFYSQNTTGPYDHYWWIDQYVRTYSDYIMNVPAVREAIIKSKAGAPVFTFTLDHYNQETWPVTFPCQGSTHSGEVPYLMEMGINFNVTQADVSTAINIQEMFLQFLRTGDPSTVAFTWNKLGANFEYMSVSEKPQMKNDWFGPSYRFWTDTMMKYSFDFITGRNWAA
ncbi:unnamed protein product, partial [Mesorhabditis spiculigera]